METPIFFKNNINEINLVNRKVNRGAKTDKCRIEYTEKNRKRVQKFNGYIQSITLKRFGENFSHHGMIFGGHSIIRDVKRVTVYKMEHLPGKHNYSIEVEI